MCNYFNFCFYLKGDRTRSKELFNNLAYVPQELQLLEKIRESFTLLMMAEEDFGYLAQ